MEHGFNGVYLGDLERLQDIQKKRDVTNRNWQRIILYNIAKSLYEEHSLGQLPALMSSRVFSTTNANSNHNNSNRKNDDDHSINTNTFTTTNRSALGGGGVINTQANIESPFPNDLNRKYVFETRQLWFKLHEKMQLPEYGNMLLLVRIRDELEDRMYRRRQRYLTFAGYEDLVNKLHLDAEGHVVEPFVALSERHDREERHRLYLESITQDLEAVLIK
jgi:hypothetical protein